MGGRGASSGISDKGNEYCTQYETVLQVDNIKFVKKQARESEPLMETMTEGRIYVHVGGDDLLRIVFFDENNKRNRVLEREKRNNTWHVHEGYFHTEYGEEKHGTPTEEDEKIIAKVTEAWNNRSRV